MNLSLQTGQPFNPYRMFTGLFIPEGLARCRSISAGAKMAWGRLARYAGSDGRCYPTLKTLGSEIGVGERQTQKYVAELEHANLIRRVPRFADRAQTSNAYEFLWHELLVTGVNDHSGEGVNDNSPRGVNDRSSKESHIEERQIEEQHRLRLSGHESQKTRFAPGAPSCAPAGRKQYLHLRNALLDYMREAGADERSGPTDRQVIDIMEAARPATEQEVMECLRYLYQERGLRPGTRNGPRHFAWFITVVRDYFRRERACQFPTAAPTAGPGGLTTTEFDAMTQAIEIEGAAGNLQRCH